MIVWGRRGEINGLTDAETTLLAGGPVVEGFGFGFTVFFVGDVVEA